MKTKVTHALAVLVLTLLSWQVLPAQWNVIPSGTDYHLFDIAFADADHAWIAADSSTLLSSTDGGLTWSSQQLSILYFPPIVSIEFIDADTGYALPGFGNAWVTHDGGATWNESTEFGFYACYGMEMGFGAGAQYFAQRGCFGENGFFTRTDTGMAYELKISSPAFDGMDAIHDIEWIDANTAIAMGDNNLVYRTSDKGVNWDLLFTKDTLLDWRAVRFVSPTEGWAVNTDLFWPLYHSTDAGLTWTRDSTWLSTFFYPSHRAVNCNSGFVFAGADINWAIGGLISERSDASFMYYETPHPVNSFAFPSATVGYAVGDSGMILRRDSIALGTSAPAVLTQPSFHLFPNPASESVTLQWDKPLATDAIISLSDLAGRELITVSYREQADFTLPLTGLEAGVYFVECRTQDTRQVRKLILQ